MYRSEFTVPSTESRERRLRYGLKVNSPFSHKQMTDHLHFRLDSKVHHQHRQELRHGKYDAKIWATIRHKYCAHPSQVFLRLAPALTSNSLFLPAFSTRKNDQSSQANNIQNTTLRLPYSHHQQNEDHCLQPRLRRRSGHGRHRSTSTSQTRPPRLPHHSSSNATDAFTGRVSHQRPLQQRALSKAMQRRAGLHGQLRQEVLLQAGLSATHSAVPQ